MNPSVKKYIDFIVGDLVKKTGIKTPSVANYRVDDVWFYPPFAGLSFACPYSALSSFAYFNHIFPKHVTSVYGANKFEIKIIWDQYSERMKNSINDG